MIFILNINYRKTISHGLRELRIKSIVHTCTLLLLLSPIEGIIITCSHKYLHLIHLIQKKDRHSSHQLTYELPLLLLHGLLPQDRNGHWTRLVGLRRVLGHWGEHRLSRAQHVPVGDKRDSEFSKG